MDSAGVAKVPLLKKYTRSTHLINYRHPVIQAKTAEIAQISMGDGDGIQARAIAAYYFVRDEIKYLVTTELSTPRYLKANATLTRGYGHCVAKAILLTALCRGLGIPARLHFVDLYNHRLTAAWRRSWGEKLLWHGYVEMFLNGTWVAANPAYDKALCDRHGYYPVEFDGKADALFAKTDISGQPFMEYEKNHGIYSTVPYLRMALTWSTYYGPYLLRQARNRTESNDG